MSDPRIIRCLIYALLFGLLLTMIFRVKEGFQDAGTKHGSLDYGTGTYRKKAVGLTGTPTTFELGDVAVGLKPTFELGDVAVGQVAALASAALTPKRKTRLD